MGLQYVPVDCYALYVFASQSNGMIARLFAVIFEINCYVVVELTMGGKTKLEVEMKHFRKVPPKRK
jgi:hypothetical protein